MNVEFELAEMLRMIVNRATSPIYSDSTGQMNVMLRAALIEKARDLLTQIDNLTTGDEV
jgi:hypothetical protein